MRYSIQDSVKKLSDLRLASELQMEILRHLIDGRRNITELVQLIYHTSKDSQAFNAEYMKVSRAIGKTRYVLPPRSSAVTNPTGSSAQAVLPSQGQR